MSALRARGKRVVLAVSGRAGAGAVLTGAFEVHCCGLFRRDEAVLRPWGERVRGLDASPGGKAKPRRRYPGLSRAAAVKNSSWWGWALDSSNCARRVLRKTTAPIFNSFRRIVPT